MATAPARNPAPEAASATENPANPATPPAVKVLLYSSSVIRVETPKRNRCPPMVASPYRAGRRERMCRAPSASPESTPRTASRTRGGASARSGPSSRRPRVSATAPAAAKNTPAPSSTAAVPDAPSPPASRSPAPTPAPRKLAAVPQVGVTALAIISRSAGTTCGSAAESPARKNRLTLSSTSAAARNAAPSAPAATSTPVSPASTAFTSAETSSTWRRDQRSMSTPANGPTTENGSSSTANAAATSPAAVCCSGLKKT